MNLEFGVQQLTRKDEGMIADVGEEAATDKNGYRRIGIRCTVQKNKRGSTGQLSVKGKDKRMDGAGGKRQARFRGRLPATLRMTLSD